MSQPGVFFPNRESQDILIPQCCHYFFFLDWLLKIAIVHIFLYLKVGQVNSAFLYRAMIEIHHSHLPVAVVCFVVYLPGSKTLRAAIISKTDQLLHALLLFNVHNPCIKPFCLELLSCQMHIDTRLKVCVYSSFCIHVLCMSVQTSFFLVLFVL